mmetsp:Transcript_27846/g.78040  ORF Transcript_27846/g.78040 Transcript_27846/m.78040 type:complete len:246 (-) Transcript_27846:1573-2310(-)
MRGPFARHPNSPFPSTAWTPSKSASASTLRRTTLKSSRSPTTSRSGMTFLNQRAPRRWARTAANATSMTGAGRWTVPSKAARLTRANCCPSVWKTDRRRSIRNSNVSNRASKSIGATSSISPTLIGKASTSPNGSTRIGMRQSWLPLGRSLSPDSTCRNSASVLYCSALLTWAKSSAMEGTASVLEVGWTTCSYPACSRMNATILTHAATSPSTSHSTESNLWKPRFASIRRRPQPNNRAQVRIK